MAPYFATNRHFSTILFLHLRGKELCSLRIPCESRSVAKNGPCPWETALGWLGSLLRWGTHPQDTSIARTEYLWSCVSLALVAFPSRALSRRRPNHPLIQADRWTPAHFPVAIPRGKIDPFPGFPTGSTGSYITGGNLYISNPAPYEKHPIYRVRMEWTSDVLHTTSATFWGT